MTLVSTYKRYSVWMNPTKWLICVLKEEYWGKPYIGERKPFNVLRLSISCTDINTNFIYWNGHWRWTSIYHLHVDRRPCRLAVRHEICLPGIGNAFTYMLPDADCVSSWLYLYNFFPLKIEHMLDCIRFGLIWSIVLKTVGAMIFLKCFLWLWSHQ